MEHGKRRVIYAIPYTSIIEQTADVFALDLWARRRGRAPQPGRRSNDDEDDTLPRRLACENWDAPLVVTTNVQLFESLFAARTSRCRKLHNLADSVIVLDEAQLLPPEFLQPILDALHLLVDHYGVTLLLCTATQPVLTDAPRFDPRRSLRGLPPPKASSSSATRYSTRWSAWPSSGRRTCSSRSSCPRGRTRIAGDDCALAIVNTRRDAADCWPRSTPPPGSEHCTCRPRCAASTGPTPSPRSAPAWPRAAPVPTGGPCAW